MTSIKKLNCVINSSKIYYNVWTDKPTKDYYVKVFKKSAYRYSYFVRGKVKKELKVYYSKFKKI